MVRFRDAVNAGDSYEGKTVYLMADIDLSTVCSSTLGSWVPIGATGTTFAGTFDGNYHTISNLYMSSSSHLNLGFFAGIGESAVVQNVVMENIYVMNTYDVYAQNNFAGGIAALSNGIIQNCGINSGNITAKKVTTYTGSSWPSTFTGGIVGRLDSKGIILDCYNKATITGIASTSRINNATYTGGLVGITMGKVENCYNTGNVSGTAHTAMVGGVVGDVSAKIIEGLKNSYNTGRITISGTSRFYGGIIGRNGYSNSVRNYCN